MPTEVGKPRRSWTSAAMGHGAADFAVYFFSFDGFSFVVRLLAFGYAEFELGAAVFEIDGQRDQGERLLGDDPG